MQEQSQYAVGIDIGTRTVRCVVGHSDGSSGAPNIIGIGQAPNSGMRKGVVSHLAGPAAAIDAALEVAERMSGHQVDRATLSVNGQHLLSTKADGMIAVTAQDGEVTTDDVLRLEEVATTGKVPANRQVLEVVPHAYRLDGQDGIKHPVGMSGTRLELKANVVSGLVPYLANVRKTAEMAQVEASRLVPAVLAAAQAVLTEAQRENGVAIVDIGASTTGVAVFEEGDLQHVAVIPMGAQHVTNDVAIGLKIDPELAEMVKLAHAQLDAADSGSFELTHQEQTITAEQSELDEIVEARYEELCELVAKELKRAGGIGRMPSGVVLVGGGAKVRGMVEFAKRSLGLAAKLGMPAGYAGVSDEAKDPAFAAAVGLMLIDAESEYGETSSATRAGTAAKKAKGFLGKLWAKFH